MGDWLAVTVRFTLYASLGLGFGLTAFRWHALPSGAREGWDRRTSGMRFGLAILAIMASGLGLAILTSRMFAIPLAQVDSGALRAVLELPGLGLSVMLRVAALAVAVFALAIAPRAAGTILAAQAVALATMAWAGHAAASEGWPGWLHLGSTILHLLGAGLWLGAIAAFLLLAMSASRHREGARDQLAEALGRFHVTGALVVATLFASGLLNIALVTGFPPGRSAFLSPWGQLMALKLAAFTGMLGLAAIHRFRLAPALSRAETAHGPIARSLGLELALALFILGLVAALGLLSPNGE